MPKSLRDRIAAALKDEFDRRGRVAEWGQLADAVIAALGLERQCHYDPDCDYYRYVTEWTADE